MKRTESRLTIAVPTFNRPIQLGRLMDSITRLTVYPSKVVILDNCGDQPATIRQIPGLDVEVHRNPINIGAVGNILRCFETAGRSDWLLVVGDDDLIEREAVELITEQLDSDPDFATIFFSNGMSPIRASKVTNDQITFVDNFTKNDFSGRLWISSAIYNMRYLAQTLKFMYAYPSSSPQLVWQLLNADQRNLFSSVGIAIHGGDDPNERWDPLTIYSQLVQILLLPSLGDSLRSRVAELVGRDFYPYNETLIQALSVVNEISNGNTRDSLIFSTTARFVLAGCALRDRSLLERVFENYIHLCTSPALFERLLADVKAGSVAKWSNKIFPAI